MTRLYVAISHHGYGHLAQTAPVLEAHYGSTSDAELLIRSALPRTVIARRLSLPFRHIEAATDCNFVMRDALRIDVPASLAAYRAFHADWPRRVDAEAEALTRLGVDLVFSNVGYLPLAAAQCAGIPSVAMCSLNWADIFEHYLGREVGGAGMLGHMRAAYVGAAAFLRPEPAMPMADLGNTVAIPPIAQVGGNRRAELAARLNLKAGDRLVLVGLGGIPHRLPVADWPEMPGIVWLLPDAWELRGPGMFAFSDTGLGYPEMLASVDALITKPGYGSFVEAARARVPVLYLPRPDWPEASFLVEWLSRHANALEIAEADLLAGRIDEPMTRLWAMPDKTSPIADGAAAAARWLSRDQAATSSGLS